MKPIDKLLKKWQRNLKLLDWDISVEIKDDPEYEELEVAVGSEKGDTSGFNCVTGDRNHSKIYLKKSCSNHELFLVHELVHILLNPLDDVSVSMVEYIPSEDAKKIIDTQRNDALEKTNWSITRALLNTFANSEQ